MPFTRTNDVMLSMLIKIQDACDKYAAPASCNTENPPSTFSPPPLAITGADESFTTLLLLIAAAFLVAGIALFIVLAMRARQKKKYPPIRITGEHELPNKEAVYKSPLNDIKHRHADE